MFYRDCQHCCQPRICLLHLPRWRESHTPNWPRPVHSFGPVRLRLWLVPSLRGASEPTPGNPAFAQFILGKSAMGRSGIFRGNTVGKDMRNHHLHILEIKANKIVVLNNDITSNCSIIIGRSSSSSSSIPSILLLPSTLNDVPGNSFCLVSKWARWLFPGGY